MAQSFMSADLRNASLGREISAKDHQPASCLERPVKRSDHLLVGGFDRDRRFLANGFSGDGESRFIQLLTAKQPVREQSDSSGTVHVGSNKPPEWLQVAEQGSALTDLLKIVHVEVHLGFASNREQVQHRVRGTATGGDTRYGIFQGWPRENVAGRGSTLQ